MKQFSIIYVGSLNEQSNSYRRYKTLSELGHRVVGIDMEAFIYKSKFVKLHHHLNIGPGINALNKKVSDAVAENNPDLLLVDNKPFLTSGMLKRLRKGFPHLKIANLITDDPTGKYKYAWRLCLQTAYLYDCHFVQRQVNVGELKHYGARRVEICHRSYDPAFHRKLNNDSEIDKKYHCQVGFIGTYENAREEFIAYLINEGIPVRVTGNDWPGKKHWDLIKPYYNGPSVYGEEYVRIINGMEIALHFLRHINRDEQDSRTFEIPACGTFMLAERSALHEQLFAENKEAVFFTTKEELLDKVRFYLSHENDRKQIADSGMKRCHQSGFSHQGRLQEVLKSIFDS